MSYKVTFTPKITLGSKIYFQIAAGYPAPTPFASPSGRPFEAIMPARQIIEGTPPPELLADLDNDKLPAFVEQALGTHPLSYDDRIPGTMIDYGAKRFAIQVSEPVSGSTVQHQIQVTDGVESFRSAVEGTDFEWADLTGAGQTAWEYNGVVYRVAKSLHTIDDHPNAFLCVAFTAEG